jgi:hypothetical protein
MATYAPKAYTGAEDTYAYLITFSYARADDVFVYVDGVLDEDWYFSVSGTKVTWDDGEEPGDDTAILIKRVTDISDAATVFTSGSGFVQADINLVLNQLIYAIDELQVPAFDTGWVPCDDLVDGEVNIEYTHSLGTWPTRYQVQYKCYSAELGYSSGDIVNEAEVLIPAVFAVSTTAFTAFWETMADLVMFSSAGIATGADPSKWRYRILAWR